MLTLSEVKDEIGIDVTDTTHDAALKRYIRQVVSRVRQQTQRGISWCTDSVVDKGTTIHIEVIGHELNTGETIKLVGCDAEPGINADYIITVVDKDTISIPAETALTKSGTMGSIHPKFPFEFASKNPRFLWIPQRWVPLIEIAEIRQRVSLTEWEVVDATTYEFSTDDDQSKAMNLIRTDGCWPVTDTFARNQWALRRSSALSNICVTAYLGARNTPHEIEMATQSLVADMFENQGGSKDMQSVTAEGFSTTRMTGDERRSHLLSPESIIMSWRAR